MWDYDFPQNTEAFRRKIRVKAWLSEENPQENFWLSADYIIDISFLQANPWTVRTFYGLYHWKVCLSPVKSAESWNFPRILPRKIMPFRGIIRGTFWISTGYPLKRHAFPRYNLREVLSYHGLSAESCLYFIISQPNQNKNRNISRRSSGAYGVLFHEKKQD
jgi:hypothetical protein